MGYYECILNSLAAPILETNLHLPEAERILVYGDLNLNFAIGCTVGVMTTNKLLDRFGRRNTNLAFDVYTALVIILMMVEKLWVMQFARFFIGFSATSSMMAAGLMLVECYPTRLSADANMVLYVILSGFLLISFLQQAILSPEFMARHWRLLLLYPILVSMSRFAYLYKYLKFESPADTLHWSDPKQPEKTLETLITNLNEVYDDPNVPEVAKRLLNNHMKTSHENRPGMLDMFTTKYRGALISGMVVMIGQQTSGINFFVFYTTELFDQVSGNGKLASVMFGLGMLVGGFGGLYAINRYTRKAILKNGTLFQGFSIVAVVVLVTFGWHLPMVIFVFGYGCSFAVGLGATAIFYNNEILPPAGVGLTRTVNWIVTGFIGKIGPIGVAYLGGYSMLIIFCVLCFATYLAIEATCNETKASVAQDDAGLHQELVPCHVDTRL